MTRLELTIIRVKAFVKRTYLFNMVGMSDNKKIAD